MKSFKSFLALVLMLLLPLHGLAASTNSLCHPQINPAHVSQSVETHADCHQAVKHHHGDHQKEKSHCVSTCGQLNMVGIAVAISAEVIAFSPSYGVGSSNAYLSVSLPKFQRPPIEIS